MIHQSLRLLSRWFNYAENFWYPMPDRPKLGCFGTGYNAWGVQTNQKYVAAAAVLAMLGEDIEGLDHQHALERALTALRFSLASHVTGDYRCADNTKWGHTWISALGIERMMHGVHLIETLLEDEDLSALRRVLTSEADWLLKDYRRAHPGISAGQWNESGRNDPESNLWNGALLWRTAAMYSDHPHAGDWKEQSLKFLINGVSVPSDAENAAIVDGRPVRERFIGANFFPNYALDHHGYLNVGYMAICVSNAAILHFDLRLKKLPRPEALDHHQADLWKVLRRMVFADARLARIGGDSRVRYAYCQDYLLPALLYAADSLGDGHAMGLVDQQLKLIEEEANFSEDGGFYSRRLAGLLDRSPYYFARLEADRANVLSMAATYSGLIKRAMEPQGDFESSVAGGWSEAEHGAALHRSRSRLASFSWRAYGLGQGMCQPPSDGHLAEWEGNLGGSIRFLGDDADQSDRSSRRALIRHTLDPFDGGFATCGSIAEGINVQLAEGWRAPQPLAITQLAFIALPDEHTIIVFQYCRLNQSRAFVSEIKGLRFNIPNDLFNGFQRTLITAHGPLMLSSPPNGDEIIDLASGWANIDGRIGVVGLFGAGELSIHRSGQRRGGKYQSLYVDELCFKCEVGVQGFDANQVLMDVGAAVVAGISAQQTMQLADIDRTAVMPLDHPDLRAVRVAGFDGKHYGVVANFGAAERPISVARATELVTGQRFGQTLSKFPIQSGQARVFLLD